MVKLSTKNFRFKNGRKLIPCYIPIKIITKINNQAYKVRLPEKYYRIYIYNTNIVFKAMDGLPTI